MRYTIITGTGRAGTTLLVQVLTRVGLDTGFRPDTEIDPIAHAGLERMLSQRPRHRVVKSPWIALELDEQLAAGVEIEHAIICTRSLAAAAESRRRVYARDPSRPDAPGALWLTADPGRQEAVLSEIFYNLIFTLTRHEIPITFLHFPRYARDHDYAVAKLSPVFPEIDVKMWRQALAELVKPDLIRVSDDRAAAN
ncbi:MAG TPA: hypothetical protein VFK86_11065 [Bauldia sp.]|nr:hypothetical protein [Bauldia sp.]